MITTKAQAKAVQKRRRDSGKRSIAAAVRRFARREGISLVTLLPAEFS